MRNTLEGKVAVVTGGARGIGHATARALKARGARVAIGDVDVELLATSAEAIGADFHGKLDVTDPEGFRAFVDEVEKVLGPVDILINNAGIMPVGHLHDEPESVARRMFEINVFGVITGTKRALDTMLPRRSGHIVNVASMAGLVYAPGAASYVGTKHAVLGFTETARYEYADSGVEFTTVLPAFVNTDLTAGTQGIKIMRNVEPEDVAAGIAAALEQPRGRVYVPKLAGTLATAQRILPLGVTKRLSTALGAKSVLLDDVDPARREAYELRARRS